MNKIIVTTSAFIIAALSLNAKEISSESIEISEHATVSASVVENEVERWNNGITETLEYEARNSIERVTEYWMKNFSEIQKMNHVRSNGYLAHAAPVVSVNFQR